MHLLKHDPYTNNVIIYWAMGIIGTNTKQIYTQIQHRLADYTIQLASINTTDNIIHEID